MRVERNQLQRFHRWLGEYSRRFFGDDEYVNANLRFKQEHTARTCEEIVRLAHELALDADETRIAELTALFHDVGRFSQFAQYRTYNDFRSIDHGQRGVEVLREEKILDSLPAEERQWVETAVALHGRRSLPSALKGRALLFTRLIRDADKIDIFRVVTEYYKRYCQDPDNFALEIELPDSPEYCPEVLEAVWNEETVDWGKLRTLTDAKLCQLGWVYDLNFTASLRRIEQCGYLAELIGFLPQDDAIQRLCQKVQVDVEPRLAGGRGS
jgi:hypothetical protein